MSQNLMSPFSYKEVSQADIHSYRVKIIMWSRYTPSIHIPRYLSYKSIDRCGNHQAINGNRSAMCDQASVVAFIAFIPQTKSQDPAPEA